MVLESTVNTLIKLYYFEYKVDFFTDPSIFQIKHHHNHHASACITYT